MFFCFLVFGKKKQLSTSIIVSYSWCSDRIWYLHIWIFKELCSHFIWTT